MQVIEATGSLTTFATEYLQTHDVSGKLRGDAGDAGSTAGFLAARRIQPSISDWLRDRDSIQNRLKQDIFNLKFGVAKGDEIEMRTDPLVLRALEKLR